MKKPCEECPFRRNSLPGWLGDSDPIEFMQTTMSDVPMPCHLTVDYSDKHWLENWLDRSSGEYCAGSLIFFSNICKRSRDKNRPVLPANRTDIFSRPQEFIDHHSSFEKK